MWRTPSLFAVGDCDMSFFIGGVAGTLGGYEFRARLVKATGGKDLPIALLEDAIAIFGAVLIAFQFS